jgi:hypothetical protein
VDATDLDNERGVGEPPAQTRRGGLLSAGVARARIDVPAGVPIGGWGARKDHAAVGSHRDITVTVLVLSEPDDARGATTVLVAADVMLWPRDVGMRVRSSVAGALDVDLEAVVLTATHTHASLMLYELYLDTWDVDGSARRLRDELEALVPTLAVRAAADRRDAGMLVTRRRCLVARSRRQVAFDRRLVGVAAPVPDAAVEAVEIRAQDGTTVATIVAYGCHPTVLAWGSLQASPDYVGALRAVLERELAAPCLFLQGCGADRAAAFGFSNSIRDADAVGTAIGHVALGALLEERQAGLVIEPRAVLESGASLCVTAASEPVLAPARVAVRSHVVELPLRERDLAAAQARVAAARARLEAGDTSATSELGKAMIEEDICLRFPDGESGRVELSVLAAGPLLLVGWPLELSGAYDAALRAEAGDRHLVVATSVNDFLNYLPWRTQFPEGGYEVDATPFAPEACDLALAAMRDIVTRLGDDATTERVGS